MEVLRKKTRDKDTNSLTDKGKNKRKGRMDSYKITHMHCLVPSVRTE